ncbi:MAG: endonuclease III [Candidatus Dadabacteria bacterium]|nr:MAG: endonuclease III [Candidatus Dadabacteria bacterium]
MDERERAAEIDRILRERYPETTALRFRDPFTLLVAAILAAQCTDERVNRVTETLFDRFPTPEAFATAPLEEIEAAIRPTGYYRQKARTLQTCCREIVARWGGRVPETVEDLTTLPGVGRKTANLVLGNSLGVPGVFVDTHVKRVSHRLGLTRHTQPDRIERDLEALLPQERWVAFSNLLTYLGREFCTARKPNCDPCPVARLCPKVGVA